VGASSIGPKSSELFNVFIALAARKSRKSGQGCSALMALDDLGQPGLDQRLVRHIALVGLDANAFKQ